MELSCAGWTFGGVAVGLREGASGWPLGLGSGRSGAAQVWGDVLWRGPKEAVTAAGHMLLCRMRCEVEERNLV